MLKKYILSIFLGSNNCHDNNGDCCCLCFANSAVDGKIQSHQCSCPTHYTLDPNNRSCSGITKMYYIIGSHQNATIYKVMNDDVIEICCSFQVNAFKQYTHTK